MHPGHLTDEQLSVLIDDELGDAERDALDGHLRACAACAARFEQLRRTVDLIHAIPMLATPRSFALTEPLSGPTEAPAPVPRRPDVMRPVWLRALAGLAAGFMVLLLLADAARPGAPAAPPAASRAFGPAVGDQADEGGGVGAPPRTEPSAGGAGAADTAAPPALRAAPASAPAAQPGLQPLAAESGAGDPAPSAAQPTAASAVPRHVAERPPLPPAESQLRVTGFAPEPTPSRLTAGQLAALALGLLAVVLAGASFVVGRRG